ncbi:MAG TPA: TerB N-terminal domain-containing protein [Nitrolancea sp.]|jgi:uncharacterized tellurite resistance protein B-like protein|nr:TerB N-terminal domain-containing protein [Nitrolancea sp.]
MSVDQTLTPRQLEIRSASPVGNGPAFTSGWVPAGQTVTIQGIEISSGMFYLGTKLHSPDGKLVPNEPSLINPSLRVNHEKTDLSPPWFDPRLSYRQMNPGDRAAYLEWLAGGRTGRPGIKQIFAFFYGLERRVLVDAAHSAQAMAEVPAIEAEVRRMLKQFGADYSFHHQATRFLLAAQIVRGIPDPTQLAPPTAPDHWDFPLELKVALGTFAVRGEPVPAEWALSWVKAHPDVHLGTPARRCPKEFDDLFIPRYTAEFGDGMLVKKNKARVKYYYSPSNRSLWGSMVLEAPDLPDVSRQRKSIGQLAVIAMRVSSELDAYSRWAGRHDDRHSLRAVSLLPPEIASRRVAVKRFVTWIERHLDGADRVPVPVVELVEKWSLSTTGTMTKREAERLSEFMEGCRYGFEPDIRYAGIPLSKTDTAMVFRLPREPAREKPANSASPLEQWRSMSSEVQLRVAYKAGLVLIRLSMLVATADRPVSPNQRHLLVHYFEHARQFTQAERVRLLARLDWALTQPLDLTALKQRCNELDEAERARIGRFMVGLIGVDGRIGPSELKTLEKVYKYLSLNLEEVSRDVHAMATATSATSTELVTIVSADAPAPSFALPAERPEEQAASVNLSAERVAAIIAETRIVGEVLDNVFTEDEAEGASSTEQRNNAVESVARSDRTALDQPYATLARLLAERPSWRRAEVEELSARFGLMAAGAIEAINEVAFDTTDEPFLEGDDPLEVNSEIIAEFLDA